MLITPPFIGHLSNRPLHSKLKCCVHNALLAVANYILQLLPPNSWNIKASKKKGKEKKIRQHSVGDNAALL